jgi:hypothetical protein
MSHENANPVIASHIGVHHPDILDKPDILDGMDPRDMSEKPRTILVRAVDK